MPTVRPSWPLAALLLAGAAVLCPATALAGAGTFTLRSVDTPSPAKPDRVEVRAEITAPAADSTTTFKVDALAVPGSRFADEIDSVGIQGVRLEGPGAVRVESLAVADLAPICERGGVRRSEWTTWRLDLPAGATTTLVVATRVPRGLPGAKAGIRITSGVLAPPGPRDDLALVADFAIPRSESREGLTLAAGPRRAGKVTFTGQVVPARKGRKVTLVSGGKPFGDQLPPFDGNRVFGQELAAFAPLRRGLTRLGTATTRKDGSFSATVKVAAGHAVVARTAGAGRGASCEVVTG